LLIGFGAVLFVIRAKWIACIAHIIFCLDEGSYVHIAETLTNNKYVLGHQKKSSISLNKPEILSQIANAYIACLAVRIVNAFKKTFYVMLCQQSYDILYNSYLPGDQ